MVGKTTKITKDGVGTDGDDPVDCYHTNFTTSDILHKKEKTDYITYQFNCNDCGKHLDMTWKLWAVEDLDQDKVLFKADGNQIIKTVLDDEKFCQSLVDSCGFELIQSIKTKIEEVRNA